MEAYLSDSNLTELTVDIVSSYLSHIGWFTVAILALLLAIDIVVIRDALKPVLRASEIASAIDPAKTNLRLPGHDMPRELLPLITSMNQALDRLELAQRAAGARRGHRSRLPPPSAAWDDNPLGRAGRRAATASREWHEA